MRSAQAPQLTDQEILDIIDVLDAAESSHRDWLNNFHAALICNIELPVDITHELAHTLCSFGCWYYKQAPEILKRNQGFLDLEQLHINMHTSARQMALKFSQHTALSTDDYHAFMKTQRVFTEAMRALRDQIYERLYSYDKLTGLMLRGPFVNILESEIERENRSELESCLVIMDVDHFKSINDNYGHIAGDRVLVKLADFLRKHVRLYDSICRYGGEEFLILLPDTNIKQAYEIMERIRTDLEKLDIYYEPGKSLHITASFGIAILHKLDGYQLSIKEADAAMYQAKESGRNKVCVA